MNKQDVKDMICQAIDNVPDCASIRDCYVEHSYGDFEAYIKVRIEVDDKSEENQVKFHNIAHNRFDSGMGFIS